MTESQRAQFGAPPRPPIPTASVRSRLNRALTVPSNDGLGDTLVNVLIIGLVALTMVGVFETWATADALALVQPVVASALIAWAWISKRRRNPRPIPLLLVSAATAALYVIAAALFAVPGEAARMSTMVILATAGAVAMVAGGERPVWTGTFVTALAAISVIAASTSMGFDPAIVIAEVLTTIIAMTIAHYAIRSVWDAYVSGSSRLSGLMEAAPVAVLEADLTNIAQPRSKPVQMIKEMNPRASRLLGINLSEMGSISRDDLDGTFLDLITQVVESDRLTGETIVAMGDRWLLVSWKAFSRRFDRVLFSGVDVTAQRAAEAALVEQIQGRDRFIATISHELRTPLTGVLGLLELSASGELDTDEANEFLTMALAQTRDMADIVQDLLVAARAANGGLSIKTQETELESIVANVMAAIDAEFMVEATEKTVAIADPVRVRQIIRNLVTNAIRYGGEHRRLIVSNNAWLATIEVRDDGPALPDEFKRKMFEPYERSGTTELPTDSVGLGLTVARTLARLMDGDLTYGHTGDESVFTLSLPRAAISSVA